jgi:hypothetical protein
MANASWMTWLTVRKWPTGAGIIYTYSKSTRYGRPTLGTALRGGSLWRTYYLFED